MNRFDIYADSAANIPADLRKSRDIRIISFTYLLCGKEYPCFEEDVPFVETAKRYYDNIRAGAEVKTSLINKEQFKEAVRPSLAAGRDALLITISSGVSGTYKQAEEAAKELKEEFPDQRLIVADSANASMAEGLLALKVADLRDLGESIDSCKKWLVENTYKMNSYFTVDDLKYLRRSGRISATLAIAGTLLNFKPILRADGSANAKIVSFDKERGRKKALAALARIYAENATNPETSVCSITHADCEEDALLLADMLRRVGAREIVIEYYDLCTGSHVGPGTVALFFMGKDRRIGVSEERATVAGTVTQPIGR